MNLVQIILIGIVLYSCGEKRKSDPAQNHQQQSTIENNEQAWDERIHHLSSKGLHFARLSNLQDPKRPMTLYCSNTSTLNHEKITELTIFSQQLLEKEQASYLINKIEVTKEVILQLITDANKVLELDPYSTTCPKIYIAIQLPVSWPGRTNISE